MTGLQYNRARYYDPTTGRWTTEDPLGFAAGDTNLYRYVGDNPTNRVDPSGEKGWEPLGTWNDHFTDEDKARWCRLDKAGWRLKDEHEMSAVGKDFTDDRNINVEVDDADMIDRLARGNDIQWRDDYWAVDYTNKRIWIDDWRRSGAYKSLKPILEQLDRAGAAGAYKTYDVYIPDDKDTLSKLRTFVEGNLDNEDAMSVKERRSLITLLRLSWNLQLDMIKSSFRFPPDMLASPASSTWPRRS